MNLKICHIVESGVKHHKPKPIKICHKISYIKYRLLVGTSFNNEPQNLCVPIFSIYTMLIKIACNFNLLY